MIYVQFFVLYICTFFLAMSQSVICGNIPSVRKYNWVDSLCKNNILITDLEGTNNVIIDILICADITGKLKTGKKLSLDNGLSLLEILLGWIVIGKIKRELRDIDTEIFSKLQLQICGILIVTVLLTL